LCKDKQGQIGGVQECSGIPKQNQIPGEVSHELSIVEEFEMKLTTELPYAIQRIAKAFKRGPIKLLGGLAVGAFILAGTALNVGPNQPGEKGSPIGIGSALPDTEYYRDPDWREYEVFRGETTPRTHNSSMAPISSNGMSANLDRIREEGRVADRQDDSRDLLQYWNLLELSSANGTLWVTNKELDNVTVLDSSSGEVIGTIAVGGGPTGVTAPPGTGKVYVSNDAPDTVSVIDKSSLSVVATISTGDKPHHITHSPNGKFVYVAEFGTNTIGVINTASDTLVGHFIAGTATARTHAVWITRDGKTLYVTNTVENTIAALNSRTGNILWALPVGDNPSEILVTPNGKTGYVTVRGEDKVKVIDLTVPEIVAEVEVGDQPDTLQLTPDLKTLVVALRGTPAEVSLVDTRTLEVRPVFISPGGTTGHQWLSANGHYTFVAIEDPGSIAVIANATATVMSIYPYPGSGKPHGVFHEPSQLE
jgi:YVTN family beta-propeller protein